MNELVRFSESFENIWDFFEKRNQTFWEFVGWPDLIKRMRGRSALRKGRVFSERKDPPTYSILSRNVVLPRFSHFLKSFCSWELLKKSACFLRAFNKCQQAFWELRVAPRVSGRIYKRQQGRWMPVSGRWGSDSCPPSFSPSPPFFSQPVNELFSPNICWGPNCNGLICQFSGR